MNYKKQNSRGKQNTKRDDYRLMRRKKYYLKNKWIFTGIAIAIVLIVSIGSLYLQKQKAIEDYVSAEIVYVIDGDTVIVLLNGQEERIRMIGIDAPESVSAAEEENSIYGDMASEYTKTKLKEGMTVYLTFDQERTDVYDRLLAYIWLTTDFEEMNNLYQNKMVSDGYALAVKYEPNTTYWQILNESMLDAFSNEKGLWSEEVFYEDYKSAL